MGFILDWWRGVPDWPRVYGPKGYRVVAYNDKGASRVGEAQGQLMALDGVLIVDVSSQKRRATRFDISWQDVHIMSVSLNPEDLSVSVPARVLIAAEDEVNPTRTSSGSLQRGTKEDTSE